MVKYLLNPLIITIMGKSNYGKSFKLQRGVGKGSGNKGGAPIRGGKIKASHILVTKLRNTQEIYEDLRAGEKFESLAQQFSICSSKNKGGNLGEFPKGKMVAEFWNACTKLKINEISQPVKSKFGYHIIKRTG
ncbi:hypothetical protein LCGC14_1576270 [marine sediment metagenome]|uniref:peptidylprolyl isomerase n=1 Tax=marine sediment metagenome TaxID=412755 RepID=A0A0F9IIB9_9ZZZZ